MCAAGVVKYVLIIFGFDCTVHTNTWNVRVPCGGLAALGSTLPQFVQNNDLYSLSNKIMCRKEVKVWRVELQTRGATRTLLGAGLKMENFCDVILMTSPKWRHNWYFWTTNWPNHATSDHRDAKNSKISNIFTKLALSWARIRQN